MNLLSWIVLLAVVLWVVVAIRHVLRHRGGCSCGGKKTCSGDCANCCGCGKF